MDSFEAIYQTVFYAAAATVAFATRLEGSEMLARRAYKEEGREECSDEFLVWKEREEKDSGHQFTNGDPGFVKDEKNS